MRRPLLLLVLALAGCGEAQPTLYERHLAAAAAFDREYDRVLRLAADNRALNQQAYCLAYFMLRGSIPNEQELMAFTLSVRRRSDGVNRYVAYIRNSLPAGNNLRELSENVERLRREASVARAVWIASTRRP